jgi:lysylphosphatidylglycerol synthetase-like protein (DUF2156 family)
VTFTTEPRRSRVVLAKFIAASGWAFVGLGAAVMLAAAAHAVAVLARDAPADWSPDWASLGGLALNLVLGVTQGVANGLWVMLPLAAGVLVLSRRELS